MLNLVVDTNLFHEFRKLEELPWNEIEASGDITLIVSDPVQTELDDHKKSSRARLKRRAVELTKRFREMILSGRVEEIIREKNPTVVLRLDDTPPSAMPDGSLDLSVPDDQLVAIAKAIQDANPEHRTCVFSDDLRPLRKARRIGVEAVVIPDAWRRAPEQTDDDRERERLAKEVARLRNQEPKLSIVTSVGKRIDFTLPVYAALTDAELDELVKDLSERHPIETNFEKAKDCTHWGIAGSLPGVLQREFNPAPENKVEQYVNTDYPAWLERCRELMAGAHERFNWLEQQFFLSFQIANEGTRPAGDFLISFNTQGPLLVMPDDSNDEDGEDASNYTSLVLPGAPEAPQGEWKTVSSLGRLADMNRGFLGNDQSFLASHRPYIPDLSPPEPRDPNAFYYRARPGDPVSRFALTCEQFRHAGPPEHFQLRLFPEREAAEIDGKTAALEVICEASNLSDPECLRTAIRFICEPKSTYDRLGGMIQS